MVALIGDYTALKKVGSSWKGLSPFAAEKTPSFYVHPDKGFFYCFSTNQGGDVFRFLMLKEGLNFQEAVERVASRFGIPVQYEEGGLSREERSLRAQLLGLHDAAAAHFATAFRAGDVAAKTVREYWTTRRKFKLEVAEEFQVGLSPMDGGGIARMLLKAGYEKEALARSGLFVGMDYSPDPLRWRPRFRGRLMIPIRDVQGRVVAFTARQLEMTPKDDPSHEAKYVNSPETEIFHKSHILFNLDKARRNIGEDAPVVLVEGQLDAIRAYTCGVRTAVASQGTAIGEEHLALVRRFTRRIDALLDADRAGQAAAMKLLPLALKAGMEVRVLQVPGGKDPDEFFAEQSEAGWEKVSATASGAISFAVRGLLPPGNEFSTAQKLEALESLYGIIAQAESAVAREDALAEACRLAGLERTAVWRDFSRYQQKVQRRQISVEGAGGTEEKVPGEGARALVSAEETLLQLVLQNRQVAEGVAGVLPPELIDTQTQAGRLLDRVVAEVQHGDWSEGASILELAESEEERNQLSHLLMSPVIFPEPVETANECLESLLKRYVKKRRNEIDGMIAALPPNAVSKLTELQRERISLRKTLQNLPQLPS